MKYISLLLCSVVYLYSQSISLAYAQASASSGQGPTTDAIADSLLFDHNSDGKVVVVAFGDSITRGVGDSYSPGEEVYQMDTVTGEAGYPLRVEEFAKIGVDNTGYPGEQLALTGVSRFVEVIRVYNPDVVVFMEGSNDAENWTSNEEYARSVQTVVNIAKAQGADILVGTIPPMTGNHSGFLGYVQAYNARLKTLAAQNGITLLDNYQAFVNTCGGSETDCYLLNLPEGLHPNSAGYDVLGEMMTSGLFQIDLLSSTGAASFESALQLPTGTVITVPNTVTAQ